MRHPVAATGLYISQFVVVAILAKCGCCVKNTVKKCARRAKSFALTRDARRHLQQTQAAAEGAAQLLKKPVEKWAVAAIRKMIQEESLPDRGGRLSVDPASMQDPVPDATDAAQREQRAEQWAEQWAGTFLRGIVCA